ncbi:DUF2637 domain-containing protein [Streptomyces fulvorobeus]|uniref:Flagellar biosynthesis GTPase FlhF n=1 Tax=Streptomyces fulvorobeus TaxID=284028 RepID=A0A7J0C8L5_9ACTN|nr:DUF2637 domain-containing protein [Streptomyces fulvorobeus]NYE42385.1 flagellar biosynthesis GTPase FlhF [Streptomyces fulvorobeus]GFM98782.1 hypothetical protein Sfulv_35930 [Streptomyces fulvorobeus]
MNSVQIRSAERALSVGTWLIVGGAMLFSILTVTPLMERHSPKGWEWTAPILPLVVDAAVVIVVRLDSVLAALGGDGGRWPIALRWMTGGMTLALNVADSALKKDLVGAAVHSVAPLLLIVTAETGLAYRQAITAAHTAREAQLSAERAERERAAEERREAQERRVREEREHAAQLAREQREHEALLAREQTAREEAARLEERERVEARERAEREARERREQMREQQQAERERLEREAAQRRELEAREREARERREQMREQERVERERLALLSAGPAVERQEEPLARATVRAAFDAGLSIRQAAELCGWSTGWVTARYQEHRDHTATKALEGANQ